MVGYTRVRKERAQEKSADIYPRVNYVRDQQTCMYSVLSINIIIDCSIE